MKQVSVNSPKLLDQLRLKLRAGHYSYRTEQAYVRWVEKFLRYHRERNGGAWRHPDSMGKGDVEEYLLHPLPVLGTMFNRVTRGGVACSLVIVGQAPACLPGLAMSHGHSAAVAGRMCRPVDIIFGHVNIMPNK